MKTIILILLLVISGTISADTIETPSVLTTINAASNSQPDYKLLYENQVKYNDKILDTIFWAIGVVFTVILLVVGSQIYFNYSLNNKKYKDLATSIDQKIISGVISTINNHLPPMKVEIQREIITFSNNFQKQLDSISSSIKDDRLKNVDRLDEVSNKVNRIDLKIFEINGQLNESKKDYNAALDDYITCGFKSMKLDNNLNYRIVYSIGHLIKNRLETVTSQQKADIETILSSNVENSEYKNSVMDKLRTMTIDDCPF